MTISDKATFIRANTRLRAVPLVPEISLHIADEAVPIWQKTEDELGEMGLPPPFWAFAWAGGQALARYVLDHRETVRSRSVIDLATGSGIVAIAAARAGAADVLAADIDGFATAATTLNAALNDVTLRVTANDLLMAAPPPADVVLVGDLFYESALAERVLRWLYAARDGGATVLVGDPGRTYLPRERLNKTAEYAVPVSRDLEDAEIKKTAVWQLSRNC